MFQIYQFSDINKKYPFLDIVETYTFLDKLFTAVVIAWFLLHCKNSTEHYHFEFKLNLNSSRKPFSKYQKQHLSYVLKVIRIFKIFYSLKFLISFSFFFFFCLIRERYLKNETTIVNTKRSNIYPRQIKLN